MPVNIANPAHGEQGSHRRNHNNNRREPSPLLKWGLVFFLLFSTFSFGAVEDWSSATCEVFLFLLAGLVWLRDPGFMRFPRRLWAPFCFALLLLVIGVIQLVPLPKAYWRLIGDERATIHEQAVQAGELLRSEKYRTDPFTEKVDQKPATPLVTAKPGNWITASFTPRDTFKAVLAIIAALALMLLLERLASRSRYDLHGVALWGGIAAVAVGFFAIADFHSKVTKVMGFRESVHATGAFGPFINENNGMGFINPAFCLLYYLIWRRIRENSHRSNKTGLVFLAVSLGIFHVAILAIRGSGAGWWIAILFPLVLVLRLLRKRPRIAATVAIISVLSLVACIVFAVHYRFTDFHGRLATWNNVLRGDKYVIGNGLGSFSERFPVVLTKMPLHSPRTWVYPENEYLQSYFEAGIPGLAAALFLLIVVAKAGWRALRANSAVFLLVPALWAGALHAGTDFDFHLWPVVGVYILLFTLVRGAPFDRLNGGEHHTSSVGFSNVTGSAG